jgi:lysophospholipase L1-like esterase
MKPLPVLNRGFGGSQMAHLVYFARRIVTRHRPRAVVVYAGDNDLDARTGKTAETVLADYRAFVRLLHGEVPGARVYFLAIKPSKFRWKRWPEMSRANAMIEAWSDGDPRLSFIDTASALLDPDGGPRDDVFRFDGLHLNAVGYAEWTRVVRPVLARDLGAP